MIEFGNYIILCIYFILLAIYFILLLISNKRNQAVINEKYLPREKYLFREIIGVGLIVLDIIHYSFESNRDTKKIAQLKGVYGEKWGVFYYRINMAERVGYAITLGIIGLLVTPASGEYLLLILTPILAVVGFILAMGKINDIIDERQDEMMKQFPNVVSNLALLINSGMNTFNAWENVSLNSEGVLYEEMRRTVTDMKTQGVTEIQAYINFGNRCCVPRITKFISMMVQNIRKGNDDLIDFLTYESTVCWEEKKNRAKIQGEKAGNKLMIPIFMIMVGILILIMGPMASNLNI